MNSKRYIIHLAFTVLFVILFLGESWSQRGRYAGIMEEVNQVSPQEAFFMFQQYQQGNPGFTNTYLQMGNLAEKIVESLDPIADFHRAQHWAKIALNNYREFTNRFQENEVSRNLTLYENIAFGADQVRLTDDFVLAWARNRAAFSQNYLDTTSLIHDQIQRAWNHYNSCILGFREISARFERFNDILLRANPELAGKISRIQEDFNISLSAVRQFSDLTRSFSVEMQQPVFLLKPISTHRIEGLSHSGFLRDTVLLWDFGSLAEEFKYRYENHIQPLRQDLSRLYTSYQQNTSLLTTGSGSPEPLKQYKDVLARLAEHDPNSLAADLIKYLNSREQLLFQTLHEFNDPENLLSESLNPRLRYYYTLSHKYLNAVEALQSFTQAINQERVSRFETFWQEHFNGIRGIHAFSDEQERFLLDVFTNNLDNLKTFLENVSEKDSLPPAFASGRRNISVPLFPVSQDHPRYDRMNHITEHVKLNKRKNPVYAAGYIKRRNDNMAFVASISDDKTVNWITEIGGRAQRDQTIMQFHTYKEGSLTVVSTPQPMEARTADELLRDYNYQSTLVHTNAEGRIKWSRQLRSNLNPFFLGYDDIPGNTFIGLGRKDMLQNNVFSGIMINKIDSAGTILWERTLDIKGNIQGIKRSGDQLLVFFNYQSYNAGSGEVRAGNDNDFGLLVVKIAADSGQVINMHPISLPRNYYIEHVFQPSATEFNLVGYVGKPGNRQGELVYLLLDHNGDVILTNMD